MKELYYWMAKHPGVELHFSRNDNPLYLVLEMTYKGKTARTVLEDRNFVKDGLYERDPDRVLNSLYIELGGEVFIKTLGLPIRAYNSLCRAGLMEYEDFCGLKISRLLKIRGLGAKSIDGVLSALMEKGFVLKNGFFTRRYISGTSLDEYVFYTLYGTSKASRSEVE